MLPRVNRLKNTKDFDRAYKKGKHIKGKYGKLAVIHRNDEDPLRVGIVVSSKLGNAVERNRAKRVTREVFRKFLPDIKKGNDISFIFWDISFALKGKAGDTGALEKDVRVMLERSDLLV